jgi:hypothetical protein
VLACSKYVLWQALFVVLTTRSVRPSAKNCHHFLALRAAHSACTRDTYSYIAQP